MDISVEHLVGVAVAISIPTVGWLVSRVIAQDSRLAVIESKMLQAGVDVERRFQERREERMAQQSIFDLRMAQVSTDIGKQSDWMKVEFDKLNRQTNLIHRRVDEMYLAAGFKHVPHRPATESGMGTGVISGGAGE